MLHINVRLIFYSFDRAEACLAKAVEHVNNLSTIAGHANSPEVIRV